MIICDCFIFIIVFRPIFSFFSDLHFCTVVGASVPARQPRGKCPGFLSRGCVAPVSRFSRRWCFESQKPTDPDSVALVERCLTEKLATMVLLEDGPVSDAEMIEAGNHLQVRVTPQARASPRTRRLALVLRGIQMLLQSVRLMFVLYHQVESP